MIISLPKIGSLQAWITLGRAQLNFGEPDSAIESFDKALSIKVVSSKPLTWIMSLQYWYMLLLNENSYNQDWLAWYEHAYISLNICIISKKKNN